MIIWKMLSNEYGQAIHLSNDALDHLSDTDRLCVMQNLVYLYTQTCQFEQAHQLLQNYKDQYSFDTEGIAFTEETLAEMEEMVEKGLFSPKKKSPPEKPATASALRPDKFVLHPAYPNPFNPSTTVRFDLPEPATIRITVYDILGRKIWSNKEGKTHFDAGSHRIVWKGINQSGKPVSSGVYMIHLSGDPYHGVTKVLLMK